MQSADFNSIEAELEEIEEDFSSGRMNAFGNAQTQEAFLKELRRIAEVETQVFYRSCALIKASNAEEHALLTKMFAAAQPPPSATTANSATAPNVPDVFASSMNFNRNVFNNSMLGQSFNNSIYTSPLSRPLPGNDENTNTSNATNHNTTYTNNGSLTGATSAPWGNECGFDDRCFEEVEERFRQLEADFTAIGDNMRQISKHVVQLNSMSEQVNSLAGTNPAPFSEQY
ncbi:hypothetical protein AGDE_04283 [Angomonas deanei]|nr:hypothetical protein AGDE_04283 [Angomonas deanei]|eukprot:EPY39645.1 hypothetical protein AGDE_04283 [Angomonas deanei]